MKKTLVCLSSLFFMAFAPTVTAFEVQILSATVKDQAIAHAEVILQKNGAASMKGVTDKFGKVQIASPFSGIDDASVTMIVKKDGYSNLVVKCPCSKLTYALSPPMLDLDGLRIVLAWGEYPADLDSHLTYDSSHVFFSHRRSRQAVLDVDDTNGYGPETITIQKKQQGSRYLYAVHNFTEGASKGTATLADRSQAKVFVYVGSSLVRTFYPPRSKVGNTWVVFGIGENGEFYDINKFADLNDRFAVGTFLTSIIKAGNFESIPDVNRDQIELAKQLNAQGEKEYHLKNLELAANLFLEAVGNDPEFAQAYSNLGLVHQKLNKSAEALWANRKAIALAKGPTKNTVQASSYFNMARIYETEGRWHEALDSFRSAQRLKENTLYTQGIQRMTVKTGL